jgi:rare lipoprotein A
MITNSSRTGRLRARRTGYLQALPCALAALAAYGAAVAISGHAEAKTPGETYCYYGKCHRVKSIAETEALVGTAETLSSSFYDSCKKDPLNPCGLTSSGEAFNPDAPDNAASPVYPDGTTLLVWSPDSRAAAVVRVNNAGPYWGDRKLDVSRATAEALGFKDRGVADLEVRVIDAPAAEEATYVKNRTYDRVPGYIGQYESLDSAEAGMASAMVLEAMAPSVLAPVSGGVITAARTGLPGTPPPAPVVAETAKPETVAVAAAPVPPQPAPEPAKPVVIAASTQTAPEPVSSKEAVKSAADAAAPATENKVAAAEKDKATTTPKKVAASKAKASASRVAANDRVRTAPRYANVRKSQRATARKSKPAMIANARPVAVRTRTAETADHPNDMSEFSRRTYAGLSRTAQGKPQVAKRSAAKAQARPSRQALARANARSRET